VCAALVQMCADLVYMSVDVVQVGADLVLMGVDAAHQTMGSRAPTSVGKVRPKLQDQQHSQHVH
jgi:hypothetical protein